MTQELLIGLVGFIGLLQIWILIQGFRKQPGSADFGSELQNLDKQFLRLEATLRDEIARKMGGSYC